MVTAKSVIFDIADNWAPGDFDDYLRERREKMKEILEKRIQELENGPDYICSYNAYNCGNFSTQAEAQKVYNACGEDDVHWLDADGDGIACEWN